MLTLSISISPTKLFQSYLSGKNRLIMNVTIISKSRMFFLVDSRCLSQCWYDQKRLGDFGDLQPSSVTAFYFSNHTLFLNFQNNNILL